MIKNTTSTEFTLLESLEEECFPSEKWNLAQIISHHDGQNSILYFKTNESLPSGYLIYLDNPYEIEILRIGVSSKSRRIGIAEKLIDSLESQANSREMFLEVSAENFPAIELYKKKGFIKISMRKRYYPDGTNAILLKKENK